MAFQATVVQRKLEEAGFEPKLAFAIAEVLERDVIPDMKVDLVTHARDPSTGMSTKDFNFCKGAYLPVCNP